MRCVFLHRRCSHYAFMSIAYRRVREELNVNFLRLNSLILPSSCARFIANVLVLYNDIICYECPLDKSPGLSYGVAMIPDGCRVFYEFSSSCLTCFVYRVSEPTIHEHPPISIAYCMLYCVSPNIWNWPQNICTSFSLSCTQSGIAKCSFAFIGILRDRS